MDEYLRAEREANRKAAALHYVGPEVGVGATIWARAVQDVLALHESARARFAANTAGLEDWERFHSTAFMLVVAVEQILGFEQTVRRLTGDAELEKARARFDYVCPDAEGLRDLVAHLDDYAVGSGVRQRPTSEGSPASITEENVSPLAYWVNAERGDSTYLNLGDKQLDLGDAAQAAIELAPVIERVRAKYLARVEQHSNDLMRQRFEAYRARVDDESTAPGHDPPTPPA